MSPLKVEQKKAIAQQILTRHYPNLSGQQREKVIGLVVQQFDGNYSPVKKEQISKGAIGQGSSLREFTIAVANVATHIEPQKISRQRLGKIFQKTFTF